MAFETSAEQAEDRGIDASGRNVFLLERRGAGREGKKAKEEREEETAEEIHQRVRKHALTIHGEERLRHVRERKNATETREDGKTKEIFKRRRSARRR